MKLIIPLFLMLTACNSIPKIDKVEMGMQGIEIDFCEEEHKENNTKVTPK